jgi:hypothetical protein
MSNFACPLISTPYRSLQAVWGDRLDTIATALSHNFIRPRQPRMFPCSPRHLVLTLHTAPE